MSSAMWRLRHNMESIYLILVIGFDVVFWLIIIAGFIGLMVLDDGNVVTEYIAYGIGILTFLFIAGCILTSALIEVQDDS
jgi:hypothetical protein